MKKPGPITASVIVCSIISVISVALMLLISFEDLEGNTGSLSRRILTGGWIFLMPVVVCGLDIVLLSIRKAWAYYYNICLLILVTIVAILAVLFQIVAFGIWHKQWSYAAFGALVTLIPAGLLIWLVAATLRQNDVKDYLNLKKDQGHNR